MATSKRQVLSPGPTINPSHQIVLDSDLKEANFNPIPTHEETSRFVERLIAMNEMKPEWVEQPIDLDAPDR